MWIYLRWNPVGCWYLLAFRLQWVHARCTFPLPSSLPLSLPPIVPMSMILRTLTVDSSRDSLTRKNSRGAIVSFAAFVSKEMENGEWRFLKDASKIVKDSERNVPGILFREIESEKFSNSRRIVHILVKFWLSPYYFLRRKGKRRGRRCSEIPQNSLAGFWGFSRIISRCRPYPSKSVIDFRDSPGSFHRVWQEGEDSHKSQDPRSGRRDGRGEGKAEAGEDPFMDSSDSSKIIPVKPAEKFSKMLISFQWNG